MALAVAAPMAYWVPELDIGTALMLSAVLCFIAWLNINVRRKRSYTLYEDRLVVEELSPGIGEPRKTYPVKEIKGKPVRVSGGALLGIHTVKIGRGRRAIRFELFRRDQAVQLANALKSAVAGYQSSSSLENGDR